MAFINSENDPRYAKCAVVISKDSYSQSLQAVKVVTQTINGVPTSWRWNHARLNTVEVTTEYRGLTKTFAESFGSSTSTMGGTEFFQYENYSKKVSRRRSNEAGGWTVTVTEKNTTIQSWLV